MTTKKSKKSKKVSKTKKAPKISKNKTVKLNNGDLIEKAEKVYVNASWDDGLDLDDGSTEFLGEFGDENDIPGCDYSQYLPNYNSSLTFDEKMSPLEELELEVTSAYGDYLRAKSRYNHLTALLESVNEELCYIDSEHMKNMRNSILEKHEENLEDELGDRLNMVFHGLGIKTKGEE